ncbi:unnamed protein product [Lepidochelys kempii]
MWKLKDKLLAKYEAGQLNSCHKSGHEGKASDVDEALFIWFKEKRVQRVLHAGPAVEEKALQLATSLGLNDFKASDSLFTRWKKCFSVAFKKEHEEKPSVGKPAAEQGQCKKLSHILERFSSDDIYNADETGFYLKGFCARGCRKK